MHTFLKFSLFGLGLVSCVPIAKYQQSQNLIEDLNKKNALIKLQADSVSSLYSILKSDFNHLSFETDEIQPYVLFTDRELINEIKKEKERSKRNAAIVSQLQVKREHSRIQSELRASEFYKEATCQLGAFSFQNLVLLKKNVVLLDIESILLSSDGSEAELKNALKNLFYSFGNRKDVMMSITLYQSGINANWKKIALQQDLLGFFTTEVKVPNEVITGVTKLITNEKSLEFGISTDSKLLLELDFIG